MKPLSLSTIAEFAGAEVVKGKGERVAFGVGIDSRTVKPGELFVAIRGPKCDGHDHVVEASERGAIAALVETSEVGKIPAGFTLLQVGPVKWNVSSYGTVIIGLIEHQAIGKTKWEPGHSWIHYCPIWTRNLVVEPSTYS